MSELLSHRCKEYTKPRRKMTLDGRRYAISGVFNFFVVYKNPKLSVGRWEYPIPKSREYWEKFCDDEEKKLLVVRDPFNLSCDSFFKDRSKLISFNARAANKSSNVIPALADSESSSHKWPPSRPTAKSSKPRSNDKKLFPKSILKVSPQAASKSPSSSCSPTPAKVKQIPQLDSLIPDSDLDRIFPCKTGRARDSGIQNDSTAVENTTSPILPTLPVPAFPGSDSK